MTIDLDTRPHARHAGRGGRQPGRLLSRGLRPSGHPDPQEVRPHPGAHHRRHRARGALPAHLPLRLRRRRGPHGALSYVDFLVPGFVVTGVLFQGMGAASGVAEDLEGGFFDRLRSLPIRLMSIVTGRVAPTRRSSPGAWCVMTAVGFARRLPPRGRRRARWPRLGLTVLYGFAFVWVFITLGLMAGSPQAAQGLSFLVFPLSFVSWPTSRCRPCRAGCRVSPPTSP